MKMPQENIDIIMFAPCGMNCKVINIVTIKSHALVA